MAQAKHLFARVAEVAMAEVMEQSGPVEQPPVRLQLWCQRQHPLKRTTRQMKDPQGVGEAAGLGPVEGQVGRPQLPDPPEPLEDRRVDQIDRQGFGGFAPGQSDRPVQRIALGAGAHPASICSASWFRAISSQVSPSPPGLSGSGSARRWSGSIPRFWMSRPLGVR